jgi:hypothetical protein
MPSCTPFHSVNEVDKLPEKRVHHNNSACAPGRDIPEKERIYTTDGYRVCQVCQQHNSAGR